MHGDVQCNILGKSLRCGRGHSAGKLVHKAGEIEGWRERKIREVDRASKKSLRVCAGEREVGVDTLAHALRIQNAHAFGCDSHIELQPGPIGDATLRGDGASTDIALKLLDVEPVCAERENAVAVLQSNVKIG